MENRAEIEFDLDTVHVARHGGVGPNLQPRPVGTDTGKRKRHGDIQICRKSLCRLTRGAFEYPERLAMLSMSMPFSTI